MSQKRKTLTLEERIKVIERSDKGDAARRIAADFNIGKTQIQNIIKDKVQLSPFLIEQTYLPCILSISFI